MSIDTQERKLTRRGAIIVCMMAFAGIPGGAQKKDEFQAGSTLLPETTPLGLNIDLNSIAFLEVTRDKKIVRISNDEIWKALNGD